MKGCAIKAGSCLRLEGADSLWVVEAGRLEIYASEMVDGELAGRRLSLFAVGPGQAIGGFDADAGAALLAMAGGGEVKIVKAAFTGRRRAESCRLAEEWIVALSAALVAKGVPPIGFALLEAGQEMAAASDGAIRPRQGLLWAEVTRGTAYFLGRPELELAAGAPLLPLTDATWLTAAADLQLRGLAADAAIGTNDFAEIFAFFQRLAARRLGLIFRETTVYEQERLRLRRARDAEAVNDSFSRLANAMSPRSHTAPPTGGDQPLLAASRLVASALGIDADVIRGGYRSASAGNVPAAQAVRSLAQASGIKAHRVLLRDEWWHEDNGPLLAFAGEGGRPVALLPAAPGRYDITDPERGTVGRLTEAAARELKPDAYMFFRPLPEKMSARDILTFVLKSCWRRDLAMIVAMGAAGGLLGMVSPIATGIMMNDIIPSADIDAMLLMAVLLITLATVGFLFEFTRALAIIRSESRMNIALEAAVWDRLLSLPVSFFRQYTVGDLANRAGSVNAIRQLLSGVALSTILSGLFSVFNLGLLFYYSWELALVAAVLVIVFLTVMLPVSYAEYHFRRQLMEIAGKISGTMFQILNGIAKFRMTGAENRAFHLWAKEFAHQREVAVRARVISYSMAVFNAGYLIFVQVVIYYVVSTRLTAVSPASFIAFNAAFASFFGSAAALSSSLLSVMDIFPLFDRTRPILATAPEVTAAKRDPGELSGDIRVSRLSFRYRPDGPYVLKDIDVSIRRGEFVAIVGPSGSGKSSLLRVLLGFEKPETGTVYYGGDDLRELDVRAVRSQLGVVIQNGQLMAGDILSNIIGSANLTVDDAWEAAALAGIDEDIRRMPMGMYTVISEGATTISGGQRQRILIARTLIKRPRIIFFDEATSALDNRTQTIVSTSLERLKATRVVIAHRLSTVANADRIYVLDKGAIVEAGTYKELMAGGGLFAELARRQLA